MVSLSEKNNTVGMFFLGVSCGFLPYVLTALFAWLLIFGNADVPASEVGHAQVVERSVTPNQPAIDYDHCYQYFSYYNKPDDTELPLFIEFVTPFFGDFVTLYSSNKSVITPDMRGSPLNS